ncbi:murein hydrolase activator EnvC family protein [Maridesulfovibrio zosterae]|uniref:murein hydrolase activator EnvC family protein n=1 Tax=Maridesulfovibrio zosterae TaxID=82171 RepID=UPI00048871A8|nr:M23 family metallopeptidase [Maridesulfovibrio zosterae]
MPDQLIKSSLSSIAILFVVVLFCSPVCAQESAVSRLKDAIQETKQTVKKQRNELLKLTREERNMFGELAAIEDRITEITRKLFSQEDKLEKIVIDENNAKTEYIKLNNELKQIVDKLQMMLAKLWPIHSRKLENRFGSLNDWQTTDRNFVWLASLYTDAQKELVSAQNKAKEISQNIDIQKELRLKSENQLSLINKSKDALLKDKLSLLSGIRGIRALKITREQEVNGLLDTINKLNYKLKSLTSRKILSFKGSLPRPCEGKTQIRFNLSAKPPIRGEGIQTAGNVDVKSIFWGKVVHNDTLRGFGRVVIIYHGYNYYSLYAYLAESFVKTGQEVEKDEIIGKTGYYPKLKETGLHFELRFHQKPVNPEKWLAKK